MHEPANSNGNLKSDSAATLTPPSEAQPHQAAQDSKMHWDCGPCFVPKCCREFNRIAWVVVFWSTAAFAQSGFINGSVNAVLSSIQLRYQITNVQLGIIVAAYDAITVIIIIFTSYYGAQGRTPRWIGLGVLVLGLAALLFAVPQVVFGTYQYTTGSGEPTCSSNSNSTCSSTSSGQNSFWIFLASQVLAGIGASPLYTIGVTYLEENAGPKASSLCIGIFMTMTVIGPAVGFILTGLILNSVYVDIPIKASISSTSSLWVGAWWLPILSFGVMLLLIWIPITGYPEKLPKNYRAYELKRSDSEIEARKISFGKILMIVLKSPTVWFVSMNSATHSFQSSVFTSFGSKYMELQFNIPSGLASTLVGAVVVSGAAIGLFVGGLVLKLCKMTQRQKLDFLLATTAISLPPMLCLLMGCSRPLYAGVTHTYPNYTYVNNSLYWSAPVAMPTPSLNSACNNNCSCSATSYEPLCGSDGVLYYSPCYAGCQRYSASGTNKVFYPCSCIQPSSSLLATVTQSSVYYAIGNLTSFATTNTASCLTTSSSFTCSLPLFLVLLFLVASLSFLPTVAIVEILMACVPPQCSSLSLAMNSVIFRLFGVIPGPIIGGLIYDMACKLWQRTGCFQDAACMQYDPTTLSFWLFSVLVSVHVIQIIFCILARCIMKPLPSATNEVEGSPKIIDLDITKSNSDLYVINSTDL